ncbi:MAG TPA: SHOCT domain-containing protein [Acidimicrobiia bacterium]
MMLIRPPVVREMRHDLWVQMLGRSDGSTQGDRAREGPGEPDAVAVRLANLKQLGELRDSGVLTEEEFAKEKARLLG